MSGQAADERMDRVGREAGRFEAPGALLLAVGGDGLVLYLSSGWQRIFGSPTAALLGRPIDDVLRNAGVQVAEAATLAPAADLLSTAKLGAAILLRHPDPEAGQGTLEGHVVCVLADPADRLLIFRDTTASWSALATLLGDKPEALRRGLEERALRSQKLEGLGTLAGGIAHDFNNLLTPIIGNAGLALLDLPAESPIRKRIEMIRSAADRAAALTRQMLAYAARAVPSVNAVNITTAIEETALLLDSTATKSSAIVYELAADLPCIEVDSTHIGQVAMNLVANAAESFAKAGGRIEVRTGSLHAEQGYLDACFIADDLAKGQYVYLEVSDDGPGIPQADRARIFDPYFTTRFTGRGLGLTAVDRIVRGYHGALELASEVGQGTRIRVLFPTSPRFSSQSEACGPTPGSSWSPALPRRGPIDDKKETT